ncbi:MAG: hypothetical protein MK135_01385 [Polyangiaceae bacterium]|nr:hypothetical protein [Polyangiaceae bacterium]
MSVQKLQVKIFATQDLEKSLESYIPVFHRLIREDVVDEMMMDVADYTHVPRSVGVILVGHAADIAIDQGEDRPGLLYSRKREVPHDQPIIPDTLRRALSLAQLLDGDKEVEGPKNFKTEEILFRFPDRLHVQNDEAGFEAVRSEIENALAAQLGDQSYSLEREGDAREPLSIRARRN